MEKIISMVIALVMLISVSDLAMANKKQTFSDVKASHWAFNSIENAAKRGVVNGHSDGTFRPESKVTREAFIKMAVQSVGYDVSDNIKNYSYLWSMPYLVTAAENELIGKDVYRSSVDGRPLLDGRKETFEWVQAKSGQLYIVSADTANYPITRVEIADISMRILNKVGKSDSEIMKMAVNEGIIHGFGNGSLGTYETASRAQALTVLDRVMRSLNGEILPTDKNAIKEAEKERDSYDRVIRNHKLPKNYKDFPYILDNIPNDMYEMRFYSLPGFSKNFKNPAKYFDSEFYKENRREKFDEVFSQVEKGVNMILNVDYKTINPDKWSKELTQYQYKGKSDPVKYKENLAYAKYVKSNKIKIEGNAKVEPSIVYSQGSLDAVRAKVNFKIVSYNKMDNKLFHDKVFRDTFGGKFSFNPKKGVNYSGYADLKFITNGFAGGPDFMGLSSETSIFDHSILNNVKYGTMISK